MLGEQMTYIVPMKKIVLVGTISNAGKRLERDLRKVIRACEGLELVEIFLVESDSTDNTVAILKKLQSSLKNFNFLSLGKLSGNFPNRIDRIRHCRNAYVWHLREFIAKSKVDYVLVADLDGMQSGITVEGIQSTFIRDDWGAVVANQSGGYYDLLALRHKTWCPNDVFVELRATQLKISAQSINKPDIIMIIRRRLELDRARVNVIYSRMLRIMRSQDWIEIDSGFGGLGIYRAQLFEKFDYSLSDGGMSFESEHVAFSRKIRDSGQTIFINPKLINSHFNTYNINRYFLIRQSRGLYRDTKKLLMKLT